MQYLLLFLEGVITFISPCLLPLLPVYVSYFCGGNDESGKNSTAKINGLKPFINATAFVIGFTIIFVSLGAFAGTVGTFLMQYRTIVNIITGFIVVLFGLEYLGVLRFRSFIRFDFVQLSFAKQLGMGKQLSFFSAFLFGIIFAIAWMPCVSKFLGAALMRAAGQGSAVEGMFMLFIYSMGLGIPFIISAVLINRLKEAFDFIKRHKKIVNIISGGLLVIVGILMMTGVFGRLFIL